MGEQIAAQQALALSIESGLLRSEEQFKRMLAVLPAPAYMCGPDGLISFFNEHAVGLWGRAPLLNDDRDRFCGSFRLFSSDGEPILHQECWMALALRFDKEFHGQEIVIERPDGEVRNALAYASPIRSDGELLGAVNVLVDITERSRAEAALAESHSELEHRVLERTQELEALNRELESFNYSVSHDLRAPLRGIDGFSRALEEEYGGLLDDTGLGYLQRIRNGAARMGELIEALLSFSRITQGGLDRREVDLGLLSAEVIESLRARQPERRVVLERMPDLTVMGDERLLGIAMENLLENAWKFSSLRDETRIEVGRTTGSAPAVYFVRDNGTGFDNRYADRMFVPFQRLHSDKQFDGSGIGLATVQRIVQRHGGRIWAQSMAGGGATFFFTLSAD